MAQRTASLKRWLVGRPIATVDADHQRISKTIGLAVFSSDAISSTAYATGEVALVLVGVGGMAASSYLIPIAIGVVVLLALVVNSYRETIHAYPDGGGSYIVSRENLGEMPSLVAGASLLIDYVLTVAVSIAAGTLAITSAFHELRPYKVEIALFFVVLLMLGNLRGLKESGRVFAVPTYVYIVMLGVFLGYAAYRMGVGSLPTLAPKNAPPDPAIEEHFGPFTGVITAAVLARAFTSGAVALTGVEAISNGIPAFRKPTSRNAAITLVWMAAILGTGFFGISFVASRMSVMPSEEESIISIMGRTLFGNGSIIYYVLQFATFAILVLAANTAFADFPRLAAIISRDGYLPRQFANRGDRLVFSNGILILAALASGLLLLFAADVTLLIPLYAVGVFTSFTLSQAGMVRHHLKLRQPHWQLSLVASGMGCVATFIIAIVAVVSKFTHGAWIVAVAIPIVVAGFKQVSRHYKNVADRLRAAPGPELPPIDHGLVVLIGGLNRSGLAALHYARSTGADKLMAISVAIDEDHADKLRADWERFGITVPLEILESPYRDLTGVVLDRLDELDREWGHNYLSVIIPQMVTEHRWEALFHNQSATMLRLRLLNRPNTALITIPYHLYDAAASTGAKREVAASGDSAAEAADRADAEHRAVAQATDVLVAEERLEDPPAEESSGAAADGPAAEDDGDEQP